jgi:RNA polymerase sigma-70 factor (ECF subfamily)
MSVEFMWTAFSGTVKIHRMALEKSDKVYSVDTSEVTLLVQKARTGNRFAFDQLIHIFQNDVFKMVFYRTRSQMDAEDLTQDIFLQAFKNLSKLKSIEKFKSWLFSIAINRVRDFYRKKKFRDMFSSELKAEEEMNMNEEHIHSPDVLEDIHKKDFWQKIESILIKLSKMEREVFTLRFMDNLNISEISGALGKSESTIKTHLYRALGKFKKESTLLQQFKEVLQ